METNVEVIQSWNISTWSIWTDRCGSESTKPSTSCRSSINFWLGPKVMRLRINQRKLPSFSGWGPQISKKDLGVEHIEMVFPDHIMLILIGIPPYAAESVYTQYVIIRLNQHETSKRKSVINPQSYMCYQWWDRLSITNPNYPIYTRCNEYTFDNILAKLSTLCQQKTQSLGQNMS